VAGGDECRHEVAADEAGRAGDENTHTDRSWASPLVPYRGTRFHRCFIDPYLTAHITVNRRVIEQ
jgi:hypothetical protein